MGRSTPRASMSGSRRPTRREGVRANASRPGRLGGGIPVRHAVIDSDEAQERYSEGARRRMGREQTGAGDHGGRGDIGDGNDRRTHGVGVIRRVDRDPLGDVRGAGCGGYGRGAGAGATAGRGANRRRACVRGVGVAAARDDDARLAVGAASERRDRRTSLAGAGGASRGRRGLAGRLRRGEGLLGGGGDPGRRPWRRPTTDTGSRQGSLPGWSRGTKTARCGCCAARKC